MADLVTHLCSALLPGALLPHGHRYGSLLPIVAFGAVLPDLTGRAVPLLLERVSISGEPVPQALQSCWPALHEPVGWMLVSVLLSACFVGSLRLVVWAALTLGCALHTGLDLLQDHHGEGYLLFAPFSQRDVEFGWMGSEATVDWVEIVSALTLSAMLPRAIDRWLGVPERPLGWLVCVGLCGAVGYGCYPSQGWLAAVCVFCASSWPWWQGRVGLFVGSALVSLVAALLALVTA